MNVDKMMSLCVFTDEAASWSCNTCLSSDELKILLLAIH